MTTPDEFSDDELARLITGYQSAESVRQVAAMTREYFHELCRPSSTTGAVMAEEAAVHITLEWLGIMVAAAQDAELGSGDDD